MCVHSLFAKFREFLHNRAANFATMLALTAPVIMVGMGAVIDYSHAITERQRIQVALDSAVLAGVSSGATTGVSVANAYLTANFGACPTAPTTPCFTFNSDGSLSGTVSYNMPTLFGAVTGASTLTLDVTAKAAMGSGASASAGNSVCILLLSTTANPGLTANSGINVNAPNCEIDVASTNTNSAANFNSGGKITSQSLCIAGKNIINNGGSYTVLNTQCATVANPYVGKLPAPVSTTCPTNTPGTFDGNSITMTPGVFCGTINFNGTPTVSFSPGVYVIKNGTWNVNGGTWTGSGVTFYFADASSKIQFNSGMSLTLSAPTTGSYSGILFYEPDGLSTSQFVFNDSVGENLTGLIYLPSRDLTFNSTSNMTTPNVMVIADTAIFNSINWSLSPLSQWAITHATGSGSGSGTSTAYLLN